LCIPPDSRKQFDRAPAELLREGTLLPCVFSLTDGRQAKRRLDVYVIAAKAKKKAKARK